MLNTGDSLLITDDEQAKGLVASAPFAPDPAVKLAYTQMQVSKTQWQSAKAAFAPTLSALYQYNTQVAADNFLKFDNSNTTPQQYWGLRLSVPLFSGNAKRYQVQRSRIDYDLKQQQYDAEQLQSAITNQNVLLSYSTAQTAFKRSETILQLYKSNDAHADKRMKEGIISMDERLRVYADLITCQNEYLQSMSDYFIQQYRLTIRQTNFSE